jgi:hypothetical protein
MTPHPLTAVLYRHEWTNLDQWVAALDDLADMGDDEIERMVDYATLKEPVACRGYLP